MTSSPTGVSAVDAVLLLVLVAGNGMAMVSQVRLKFSKVALRSLSARS